MTERGVTESIVEEAALAWPEARAGAIRCGPAVAAETPAAVRVNYGQIVLKYSLRDTMLSKFIRSELQAKDAGRLVTGGIRW